MKCRNWPERLKFQVEIDRLPIVFQKLSFSGREVLRVKCPTGLATPVVELERMEGCDLERGL